MAGRFGDGPSLVAQSVIILSIRSSRGREGNRLFVWLAPRISHPANAGNGNKKLRLWLLSVLRKGSPVAIMALNCYL